MRSCENCNARLLAGATSCPQCGVYAGEYVEGAAIHPRKPRYRLWISLLLAAAVVAAASYAFLKVQGAREDARATPKREPVRVVGDRPGGAFRAKGAVLSEPEATMLLRRSFTGVDPKCIAILSNGYKNGAYTMTVMNGCDHTRLGQWRVDGKTKAITPASPR
ncbi:MAG TPA: hypothetical protein VKB93_05160 [Thermoanaerobaculia bacterium]|nr:hypothetical protein [Thermoanaerobaculia bacterium]